MDGFSQSDIDNMEALISLDEDADMFGFWDSPALVQWFASKGYTFYERAISTAGNKLSYGRPRLPYDDYCEAAYPYAYHDARTFKKRKSWIPRWEGLDESLYGTTSELVTFAQDAQGRHVAIKIARAGSDEHKIWCLLHEQELDVLRENYLLPILELLYVYNVCFAIMPRWGCTIHEPQNYSTLRDALHIMHARLKAVVFMHSHNIIHRDLRSANFLVNHFGNDMLQRHYFHTRHPQLQAGQLLYGLIDYNLSILLPGPVDRTTFRLPCRESYPGTPERCNDTAQGEFDYNPFAFDMGCLGVDFCSDYQCYTRDIPLLAPFLDKLITRDVSRRFTAEQALEFMENEILASTTEDQLAIKERPDEKRYFETYEYYDRWDGLPEDFKTEWAAYREPLGVPLTWRILRYLMSIEWLPPMLIPHTRLLFFRLSYIPRLLWGQFTSLVRWGGPSVSL